MQISKKGMTPFVTFDASRLTDVTLVTVTPVTSSQADLYNTASSYTLRPKQVVETSRWTLTESVLGPLHFWCYITDMSKFLRAVYRLSVAQMSISEI